MPLSFEAREVLEERLLHLSRRAAGEIERVGGDPEAVRQAGALMTSSYHCSERPGSGKVMMVPDEKEIGITTSVGATRKISNKAVNPPSRLWRMGRSYRSIICSAFRRPAWAEAS